MSETKFHVIISETNEGFSIEIMDFEGKEKSNFDYPKEKEFEAFSTVWMAKRVLQKYKELIRMSVEELSKKKQELREPF